jgi:integral membrane sensor domain MASE1
MSVGVHLRVAQRVSRWRSILSAQALRYVAGVVLIAIGYDVFAQGGEALLLTGPAGAFWPATGVGIAVLYLGGLRWWPGVLLGDLLSREWSMLPLGTALAESAGNIARALVAVVILRRLIGSRAAMVSGAVPWPARASMA